VEAVLAGIDESPLIFSKTVSTISEYLEDIDLFHDLNDRDYAYLEENSSIVTFLAGDTIMGRFESGIDFYVLVDGKATVWIKDAFSREQFMAEFLKGDFMGESGLLAKQKHSKHHRSATIKAETPCTLVRISPDTMSRILWKYPKIMDAIREINEARLSVRPKSTDKLRVYKPKKGH
ncbi:MAG: cyclic nucleotide-binding domain-containing protein, partial [Gammaproteobacteria bacterium]